MYVVFVAYSLFVAVRVIYVHVHATFVVFLFVRFYLGSNLTFHLFQIIETSVTDFG